MRCINCDGNNWENVDGMRIRPEGMCICKECGFVSYPARYRTEEEMRKHYNTDYRKPPTSGNFFTGRKKMFYHETFLAEFFEDWKKKESFKVCDIGAAFGMFLAWFKQQVPKCEVFGTEWDDNYVANALHEYGIQLTRDIDKSQKYDLISLYKVGEHQLDFDKKLMEYRELLDDDGSIYLSVPVWFDMYHNFGPNDCDLEYCYDPNHHNVWTRNILKSIIAKAGFQIVKENYTMYDDTYLLKKITGDVKFDGPFKEDPEEIKKMMVAIRQAFEAYGSKNFEAAVRLYPRFPMAWRGHYEANRKAFHDGGIERLEKWMEAACRTCPNSAELVAMCADIYMRYEMYDRAIDCWKMALQMRPGTAHFLGQIAHCLRGAWKQSGDVKYLKEARDLCRHITTLSPEHLPEMLSWIYLDNIKLYKESKK